MEKLATIQEIASRLASTDDYVYKLVQDGQLRAIRIGQRALRITESSYDRFVAAGIVDPADYFGPPPGIVATSKEPDRAKTKRVILPEPPVARSQWMQKTKTFCVDEK